LPLLLLPLLLFPAGLRAAEQTLAWISPTNGAVLLLNQPYPLEATASSSLPVTFRVRSGPAEIAKGIVRATNVGTIVLVAEQAGDPGHAPVRETRTVNQSVVQLVQLGSSPNLNGHAWMVEVSGNHAYLADGFDGLQIIDVSNPMTPVRVGRYNTGRNTWGLHVVGNLAYVVDYDTGIFRTGFQIVDVTNPISPFLKGRYLTFGAISAEIVGNRAFVANGLAGLQILDVSNPMTPMPIGGYNTSGEALSLQVVGNRAYVADRSAGLQIVDISAPAAPVIVGSYNTSGEAYEVRVVDNLAYVADDYAGLQVVDVSNPADPIPVGSYATGGNAQAVQLRGNLAYVAAGYVGLQVVDVSNPLAPLRVGGYDTRGTARNVRVVGNLAYLADGERGLQILRLREGIGQTLAFDPPTTISFSASTVSLSATTTTGLPVTFTVVSGPSSMVGNQLTLNGEGIVVLRAEQAGNEQFLPVSVERTLSVVAPFRLDVPRLEAGNLVLTWSGGTAPFTVWRWNSLAETPVEIAVTSESSATLPADGTSAFYQVRSAP